VPIDWIRDAFGHLKVVGHMAAAEPLAKAYIADDLAEGVNDLDARTSIGQAAKQQRVWNREARLSEGAI
jgi:catalase